MDPIMIGIAAVVILVIVAGVFLMKKGKNETTVDTQTQVKRPKTLAEQQRELELQRQSHMPSPATPDLSQTTLQTVQTPNIAESAQHELQAAEQLIQTQDYDGAITTLRRALKNHPSHSELNFTLLNSYALAKDYQHFNTFYLEVLALNDADLTTQANNLKMLVDEEQRISARSTVMTDTAEAVESDGLDFDLPGFKQDSDKPAINSTLQVAMPSVTEAAQPANPVDGISNNADNELDFDFALDVPETKIAPVTPVPPATKPTTETTAAQPQSNELTFADFDFDLPSNEPATAETVPAPALESPTEIFAPIDEPVTTASASNVNNNNNAISDSDFDFDFSLPETQSTPTATATAPMLTSPTAAPSADNNIADDFDFDFALDVPETKIAPVTPVPPATKPTTETTAAQPQSNELTFADFDFDLPSNEPATAETVPAPALESPTEIFAPIDEPVTTASASNVNNNNNAISDSDFDFDFSLPETQSTPTATATAPMLTSPTAAPSADNNIADDFDFDFELNAEPAVTVTPTNDATTETDLSFGASDIKASSNLTSDAATSVPFASDEATDIASFALDDELLRQAEAASLAKPATPSVAEPVVDLAEVSAPEVKAPKPSDSLLISDDMFDLSFDDSTTQAATPANTQTTTTPIASPETTSIADNAISTTAPVVEDLSAILDVIKDIDTDTLNVDLAEQYVNLGEYDSAKRLLDEIKDSNNTALVERATALRQRIA